MEYQEPTSSDQALEASIKEIMPTLPPTVRAYLGSGKYSQVAQGLMRQYGLHVDQGGVLERELMLLIMGLSTPAEFVEHLQNEAYIPADVTRAITDAVNQQVFIPMRDEMRGAAGQGGGAPMAAAEPVGSARSAPVAQAVAAQPRVVPPPPSYGSPRPAAPVAHPPAVGAGIALPPVPPAAPQGAPAPLPVPAPAAPPAPAPLPPRAVMPGAARPAFTRPAPLPPPNLPTGAPAQGAGAPPATLPHPVPPLAKPAVPAPPARLPYSTDPYREPIE